jgi:hypothetical protein
VDDVREEGDRRVASEAEGEGGGCGGGLEGGRRTTLRVEVTLRSLMALRRRKGVG